MANRRLHVTTPSSERVLSLLIFAYYNFLLISLDTTFLFEYKHDRPPSTVGFFEFGSSFDSQDLTGP